MGEFRTYLDYRSVKQDGMKTEGQVNRPDGKVRCRRGSDLQSSGLGYAGDTG